MRHFQMHVLHKTDFQLLVYRHFRRASTTRGRHSHEAHQAPQTRFHQAGVEETANSLLKDGAKIHLKNERKINRQTPPKLLSNVRSKVSPNKRAPQTDFSKAGFRQTAFRVGIFPKLPKRSPRCATLIKSRVLMALAGVRERGQKRGPKVDQKSGTEMDPKRTLNGP
jgi:hypothetical protein